MYLYCTKTFFFSPNAKDSVSKIKAVEYCASNTNEEIKHYNEFGIYVFAVCTGVSKILKARELLKKKPGVILFRSFKAFSRKTSKNLKPLKKFKHKIKLYVFYVEHVHFMYIGHKMDNCVSYMCYFCYKLLFSSLSEN